MPLGEKAAVRAVGYYTRYGGFIDALREGGGVTEDVNSGERYGGRIAMTFEPSETVSITPRCGLSEDCQRRVQPAGGL